MANSLGIEEQFQDYFIDKGGANEAAARDPGVQAGLDSLLAESGRESPKSLGNPEKYKGVGANTSAADVTPSPSVTSKDGTTTSTAFGGYTRVTDNRTGAETWYGQDGKTKEVPRSVQMMDAINAGLSPNMGTAASWDDAIKRQSGGNVAKSEAYARAAINANMSARDRAKTRVAKQNAMTGDLIGAAMADMRENLKIAQANGTRNKNAAEGEATVELQDGAGKNAIYEAKDGNYYVQGIVRADALDAFNAESSKYGGRDKAERIVASQRVDEYGNPVGDPTFSVLYRKNGNINEKGDGVFVRTLTLGDAMNSVVKAQIGLGKLSEADARAYAIRQFGSNPFKWSVPVTEQDRFAAEQSAGEADRKAKVDAATAAAQSKENVAQIGAQAKVDAARIAAEAKGAIESAKGSVAKKEGISDKDLATLYNAAANINNLGMDDEGKRALLELVRTGIEQRQKALSPQSASQASASTGDNVEWTEGAEYRKGMSVPVGGSVRRNSKTYYKWADGSFHTRKENAK